MDFSNIAITKLANKAVDDGRHWTERLRWQQYEQLQQEEQRDDYDDMLSGASCIEMKGDTTNNNEHNNTKSQICDEMYAIRQRVNQRSSKAHITPLLFVLAFLFVTIQVNVSGPLGRTLFGWLQNAKHQTTTPWTLDKDLRVVVPHSMILIGSSLLWCPNAKSGTSTVYDVLWQNNIIEQNQRCYDESCSLQVQASKKLKSWSSPKPLSFVIVRNPYSRIRSAYVGKIQTGRIKVKDANNRPIANPSFYEFLNYVKMNPTKNIHWTPVSSRCLVSGSNFTEGAFQYDYILKLEEDDVPKKLTEIFKRANIDLPVEIERSPKNQHTDHSSSSIVGFYREAAEASNVTVKELIQLVGQIYKEDIEPFGYSFPEY